MWLAAIHLAGLQTSQLVHNRGTHWRFRVDRQRGSDLRHIVGKVNFEAIVRQQGYRAQPAIAAEELILHFHIVVMAEEIAFRFTTGFRREMIRYSGAEPLKSKAIWTTPSSTDKICDALSTSM